MLRLAADFAEQSAHGGGEIAGMPARFIEPGRERDLPIDGHADQTRSAGRFEDQPDSGHTAVRYRCFPF
jgi:hypothetical protein